MAWPKTMVLLIKDIVTPPKPLLTIKSIHEEFMKRSENWQSMSKIRRYLKEEMKYSYRTGWQRIPKSQREEKVLSKTLFWTELLDLLYSNKLVFHIDESSFDRHLYTMYTWLPIKGSKIMLNGGPKGRCNLLLATGSNGSWLAYIQTGKMTSKDFWYFLMLFNYVLNKSWALEESEVILTFDNARTHTANLTKKICTNIKPRIHFLPPYWPEVAPVEKIFGVVKSKMKSRQDYWNLDFSKEEGATKIIKTLSSLEGKTWLGAWRETIKSCRDAIVLNWKNIN